MMNSWVGIPESEQVSLDDRIAWMYNTRRDIQPMAGLNDTQAAAVVRPGGNWRGPIRELGRFYEMLLAGGESILKPETVTRFTSPQRIGMYDHTFRHDIDWGLGFNVDSNQYGPNTVPYGYGRHASPAAFGHGGSQSSAGFADPEHRLVVAIVCNGMLGEPKHQRRARELHTAIYEDLGLATA